MVVVNEVTTTKMEQSKELAVAANNVEVPLQVTTNALTAGKRLT